MTSTMTFLSAKMYHDFYPDSNARPYVWASAALIPAVTGYLRIRGGKHYLTDVLVGYGVGTLVGVLVANMATHHAWLVPRNTAFENYRPNAF